jgi:hypothetical protein
VVFHGLQLVFHPHPIELVSGEGATASGDSGISGFGHQALKDPSKVDKRAYPNAVRSEANSAL